MKCPRCQHENGPRAKFCQECAAPLARTCSKCGNELPSTAKFCPECAHPAGDAVVIDQGRFSSPETYTPKHLAEKILTSKAALEGEPKQVTVLFADMKGSMELLADRDPEEARKILDLVLELMMEAVHRYEGTVNQAMGDGDARHDGRRGANAEEPEDRNVIHILQPRREVLPRSLSLRHHADTERAGRFRHGRCPLLPGRAPGAPRGHRDVRRAVPRVIGHQGHSGAGKAPLELDPRYQAVGGGAHAGLSEKRLTASPTCRLACTSVGPGAHRLVV